MARPRPLPDLLLVWPAVVLVVALTNSSCHSAGCRDGDQACAASTTSSGGGSSSGDMGTSGTSGGPAVTTSIDTSGEGSSTGTTASMPAVCGDGVVEGDEGCDDGNADNLDGCLNDCTLASCGDGFVRAGVEDCEDGNEDGSDDCVGCRQARCGDGFVHVGVEECDAGSFNSDALYGGCGSQCKPGPRCGDGKLNGPEECDDNNSDPQDGCLEGCIDATSCKQVLELVPGAVTGEYRLWPAQLGGNVDVPAWCDMDSDGGGYTFLKVDTQVIGATDKGAQAAEAVCQKFGMHLLVPRTPAHVKAAYEFATTVNVMPVSGGGIGSGVEYLSILAIYPEMPMATCDGKGLNITDCPKWRAWDDHGFWVTDKPVLGEPSEEHCAGCSMLYKWNPDGSLKSYTTFPAGDGASSYRFICDVADKF
jgi:cysteine-rich repeat protein